MNLEKLLELIMNSPENISIKYSNINGEEKLIVNGEDLTNNNSQIRKKIADYKQNIELLDDCIFVSVLDELAEEEFDIKNFNDLLNQDTWIESEENCVSDSIDYVQSIITKHIVNKIEELQEMLENL